MATNSSRGNPIGATNDAPVAETDQVPPVSEETKADVSTNPDTTHQGGEDASAPPSKDQNVVVDVPEESGSAGAAAEGEGEGDESK